MTRVHWDYQSLLYARVAAEDVPSMSTLLVCGLRAGGKMTGGRLDEDDPVPCVMLLSLFFVQEYIMLCVCVLQWCT
jgi:hypothetical protein